MQDSDTAIVIIVQTELISLETSVTVTPEGSAEVGGYELAYGIDDAVTFTVTANAGYEITRVTVNGYDVTASDNVYSYTVKDTDSAVEIVVETAKKQLTVSKTVTNATLDGLKESYTFGENVQFTVTPETGYEVTEVKVNDSVIKAVEGTYSYTVLPEDTQITITVTTQLITLTPELGEIDGATVNGLEESYNIGNTVMFTITTEEYVTVDSVTVNGEAVTEQDGTYSYVIKESDIKLTIAVATTRHATVYDGKGELIKNFTDITASPDDNKGKNNVVGALYSFGDHGNAMPSPSAIEAVLYGENISAITENGTRFGLRLYNRANASESNNYFADVVIARQGGNWVLDIGAGVSVDTTSPSTAYVLNAEQIAAVEAGTFRIFIIQEGNIYTLYAQNGDTYDKVEAFTGTEGKISVTAIDLVVNSGSVALQRSGDRDFGVKELTVYGGFDDGLTDEELIQLLVGGQVAARKKQ